MGGGGHEPRMQVKAVLQWHVVMVACSRQKPSYKMLLLATPVWSCSEGFWVHAVRFFAPVAVVTAWG